MKHISTLMIMLIFMALFVAGCSSTMGGKTLTLTGGDTPAIECKQGDSILEIKPDVLPFITAPKTPPTGGAKQSFDSGAVSQAATAVARAKDPNKAADAIAKTATAITNANVKIAATEANAKVKAAIDFVNGANFKKISIECKELLDRGWLETLFD